MKTNFSLLLGAMVPLISFAQTNTQPNPIKEAPRYNNRMAVFGPFHQVYERTKPKAFYSGSEAWLLFLKRVEGKRGKLLNAEVRYGYNFVFKEKNYFTPFLGLTYIQNFHTHKYYVWNSLGNRQWELKHKWVKNPGMLFASLGFYYDHSFSTVFDLGFKLKGMIGGKVSTDRPGLKAPITGLDVALPFTFRFGPKRHWDYRLEPFGLILWGAAGGYESFLGLRNTLGYRF